MFAFQALLLPVDLTFTFSGIRERRGGGGGEGVIWATHMMRGRETETHFYGSHSSLLSRREEGKEGKLIMLWKPGREK